MESPGPTPPDTAEALTTTHTHAHTMEAFTGKRECLVATQPMAYLRANTNEKGKNTLMTALQETQYQIPLLARKLATLPADGNLVEAIDRLQQYIVWSDLLALALKRMDPSRNVNFLDFSDFAQNKSNGRITELCGSFLVEREEWIVAKQRELQDYSRLVKITRHPSLPT